MLPPLTLTAAGPGQCLKAEELGLGSSSTWPGSLLGDGHREGVIWSGPLYGQSLQGKEFLRVSLP